MGALEYLTHAEEGEKRATQSYSGESHRRGELAPRELTIARFRFQVIGPGDSIPA